jgi:hypothetical protein
MELVYPIYLDIPMMSAFLASLENGLMREADVEAVDAGKIERAKKFSADLKPGGLFSALGVGISGGLSRSNSDQQESRLSGKLTYPEATLFIRLRDLLIDNTILTSVSSLEELSACNIGDLIEVQGLAIPNPGDQISRVFRQLMPLIEPFNNVQIAQLDQQIAVLKTMRAPNDQFKTQADIGQAREFAKSQQELKKQETDLYKRIGDVVGPLFAKDSTETIVLKSTNFPLICHLYPEYARNERLHDLYDSNWRCIGKVVAKLDADAKFDLLKGSPISYVAQSQIGDFSKAFNNENLKVDISEPSISGPAVVVATLALFA